MPSLFKMILRSREVTCRLAVILARRGFGEGVLSLFLRKIMNYEIMKQKAGERKKFIPRGRSTVKIKERE